LEVCFNNVNKRYRSELSVNHLSINGMMEEWKNGMMEENIGSNFIIALSKLTPLNLLPSVCKFLSNIPSFHHSK